MKDLRDPKKLESFVKEKGMKAFTFVSEARPHLDIDIIIEESISFKRFYDNKMIIEAWDVQLPVCHIDDLIDMKRVADRAKDREDIENLLNLKRL